MAAPLQAPTAGKQAGGGLVNSRDVQQRLVMPEHTTGAGSRREMRSGRRGDAADGTADLAIARAAQTRRNCVQARVGMLATPVWLNLRESWAFLAARGGKHNRSGLGGAKQKLKLGQPRASASASSAGKQRDPQAQEDKAAPGDLAQRARDISSPGAQEDATASGPKGV